MDFEEVALSLKIIYDWNEIGIVIFYLNSF